MTTKIIKDKVKTKVHSQDSIPSFIRKTYDILEERKFPDVIDWNPEGTALVIKKPSDFCQKVLPAYFKHNNLTSFVRQLNMYNFHKRRTQNIDHVYYHELFQKGKKHLLKEIKRKNHENNSDKGTKGVENIEPTAQSGKDVPTLMYENQVLRRLYNDANSKVALLENQVRELSGRNQNLWSQLCQHSDSGVMRPAMNRAEKQASLTADQLPMTFGDISIPPLKLISEGQPPRPLAKNNWNNILNIAEISAETTEASHSPPSIQTAMDSERGYPNGLIHVPGLTITPQISQLAIRNMRSDLFASRAEMSVGQLFEAWNQENQSQSQNQELITFVDQQQRGDKTPMSIQAMFTDPVNVLGKRLFDEQQLNNIADSRFNIPEPMNKRSELSVFNRRGMISTGTEDREFLKAFIRRESSINDEFDTNTGVDLMDFNHPFLNSTKASS